MDGLAVFFFLVAVGCGVAVAVHWANARGLRHQLDQARAQIAGMSRQIAGMQHYLQAEAGARQTAQQHVQVTRQQLDVAQRVAYTASQQAQAAQQETQAAMLAARREAADLARSSERSGKLSAKELERAAKDAADAQRRGQQVADRYVSDTVKRAESDMTSANFETNRTRVDKVISFCSSKGFRTASERDAEISQLLRAAFEEAIRREGAREEQRRIKEQIREEQRADRERQKELDRLEQDEKRIEKALADALSKAKGEHDVEVERLKQMLADAEARAQRAKSQAQMTKAGFVYVISNIGSFGDGTYKVGMTRRLEPMDRVIELGDASVPFPFDVHMMISCNDAPTLETALHRELNHHRVNKVNLRKEFFRVPLDRIASVVEKHHGKVEYVADPEALEYRETILMQQRGQDPAYDPRRDEENEDAGTSPLEETRAVAES